MNAFDIVCYTYVQSKKKLYVKREKFILMGYDEDSLLWISGMSSYLHADYCPHFWCYYNVSVIVPSGLHEVIIDLGNLQGILKYSLHVNNENKDSLIYFT